MGYEMDATKTLISSLTSKCQTTIPAQVRKLLGLSPGDRVKFEVKNGEVTLSRLEPEDKVWLMSLESTVFDEWSKDDDDDL